MDRINVGVCAGECVDYSKRDEIADGKNIILILRVVKKDEKRREKLKCIK